LTANDLLILLALWLQGVFWADLLVRLVVVGMRSVA
jgi:hypothetical protein